MLPEKVRQVYVWFQIDDQTLFETLTRNTEFKKCGVCEIEGLSGNKPQSFILIATYIKAASKTY